MIYKKGEILLKKAVLAILIAGMAVLTACSNNNTVKKDDNVYKYSDYEYIAGYSAWNGEIYKKHETD